LSGYLRFTVGSLAQTCLLIEELRQVQDLMETVK